MKERPILFNGSMVRAILDGSKTQTRRAIKLKTGDTFDEHALTAAIQEWRPVHDDVAGKSVCKRAAIIRCPYGMPGDRLWVREAWCASPFYDSCAPRDIDPGAGLRYPADGPSIGCRTRPSIHMPRWASRILLEISDVRVERLQDISETDAQGEGVEGDSDGWFDYLMPSTQCCASAHDSFVTLWESINGSGSWDANPLVWVVEFRRMQP